ncbi:hypothetical protein ABBQ38_005493 [Trebouxia sp. C0009 RCD-2024]
MGRVNVTVALVYCKPGRPTEVQQIEIDDAMSLKEFSEKIGAQTGKHVQLTYRGQPLDQDHLQVYHYAPASASIPRFSALLRAIQPSAKVLIETVVGKIITIHIPLYDTVAKLKQLVCEREGIPQIYQRMTFGGNQLADPCTLLDYGVQDMSSISMAVIMYGGGAPANFTDVSNSSTLETIAFSDEAPAWRESCAGLNVEGRCANPCCQAYRQMVIDPKGMVSWSLTAGQAHCPMCHKQFPPVTCAFTECSWAFDGCKLGSSSQLQHVQGDYQAVSADKYHRFEEHDNQTNWQMLVLSAKQSEPGTSICPICWEHPDDCDKQTTSCGHTFRGTCIDAWKRVQQNAGCPMCRRNL